MVSTFNLKVLTIFFYRILLFDIDIYEKGVRL
jgi:hypothetical protein